MGNRLHYAKTRIVEYSTTAMFSFGYEEISNILCEYDCEIIPEGGTDDITNACERGDNFVVSKADIKRLVSELRNTTAREICGLQVEDVIVFFDDALKNAEQRGEYIYFSWF